MQVRQCHLNAYKSVWSSGPEIGSFIVDMSGFPQALEIMETWKIKKKSSMHGNIMKFEKKTWIIMENSWNLVK